MAYAQDGERSISVYFPMVTNFNYQGTKFNFIPLYIENEGLSKRRVRIVLDDGSSLFSNVFALLS